MGGLPKSKWGSLPTDRYRDLMPSRPEPTEHARGNPPGLDQFHQLRELENLTHDACDAHDEADHAPTIELPAFAIPVASALPPTAR